MLSVISSLLVYNNKKQEIKKSVESYSIQCLIKKYENYWIKDNYKKYIFKPYNSFISLFNFHINRRRK